jgi:hypothetical protein
LALWEFANDINGICAIQLLSGGSLSAKVDSKGSDTIRRVMIDLPAFLGIRSALWVASGQAQ